ncbi:MAG TPA: stage II sporulation protein M, partial [Gemmatirosa sp.]
ALGEDGVRAFAAEYRDAAADLARLTTALGGRESDDAFRLGRLVSEGHNLLYRRETNAPRTAFHYVLRTLPREVRRAWRPIALAALLLFGPMLTSAVVVARRPALATEFLSAGMRDRAAGSVARARAHTGYIADPAADRPIMSSGIIANNVQVTYLAFAAGITAGVGTVLALVVNGVDIGGLFGLYHSLGTLPLLLAFVAPHGVLELTAIAVGGGAGFLLAAGVLLPGARTRREAIATNARHAIHLVVFATLLLLVAGTLEGLVSPIPTWPLGAKLAVSGATAAFLAAWLSLGGAPAAPRDGGTATARRAP